MRISSSKQNERFDTTEHGGRFLFLSDLLCPKYKLVGWLISTAKKVRTCFFFENKRRIPKNQVRTHDLAIWSLTSCQLSYTEVGLEVGWLFRRYKRYHNEVSHFFYEALFDREHCFVFWIFAMRFRLLNLPFELWNSWNSWNSCTTSTPKGGFIAYSKHFHKLTAPPWMNLHPSEQKFAFLFYTS